MIDLHSHILAGIDDGASTLDDSIALVKHAAQHGVSKILATPHIHFGTFDNDLPIIQKAFNELTSRLQEEQIDICVAYAAEVRICPEIILLAKTKKLPFMGKWHGLDLLLLEFPHSHILPGSEKLVDWLLKNNIKPMIAHPERNRELWEFPELLSPLKQRGCLFQITAASLVGDFGERSKNLAWQLLEEGTATIVASDMHNLLRRPCKMRDAYKLVSERLGHQLANSLFIENPSYIFESNLTAWTLN